MKLFKITLLTLSLCLAFSACKKDDDTGSTGSTSLPEGNYVKFGSTTHLENSWVSTEYKVEAGRPYTAVYFNAEKSSYFIVQFAQAPVLDNSYAMGKNPEGNTAYVRYFSATKEPFVPEGNGTVVIKMVDGKKVVEVHGPMKSATTSTSGQLDARFVWND